MPVDIAKIEGTSDIETATPAEVAEVVFSNDDVEIFTTEEKDKLDNCARVVFLTQDEYDAIVTKDPDIWYNVRPEV